MTVSSFTPSYHWALLGSEASSEGANDMSAEGSKYLGIRPHGIYHALAATALKGQVETD